MSRPTTPTSNRLSTSSRIPTTPSTPRSKKQNEIKGRLLIQSTTTLTISIFTNLIVKLNSTSNNDNFNHGGSNGRSGNYTELDKLDLIEAFRFDFLTGAFNWNPSPSSSLPPSSITNDSPSTTSRRSSFISTSITSTLQDLDLNNYRILTERGIQAEKNIKRSLKEKGLLVKHCDFKSLIHVVKKILHKFKISAGKKVLYVDCGMLRSSEKEWKEEYLRYGFSEPGLRWGNYKPDLLKFEKKSETDEIVWEVVEIKYSSNSKGIIYPNYKIQAIFYHMSLLPLLSTISNLVPSHKVSIYLSTDPTTPNYIEKSLALRTNLAWVEHHLFVLLPKWLEAVTVGEFKIFEERRKEIEEEKRKKMATPGLALTFLNRLQGSTTSTPSQSPTRPIPQRSPLRRELVNQLPSLTFLEKLHGHSSKIIFPDLGTLPPLPDEQDDEDVSEMFGRKLIF